MRFRNLAPYAIEFVYARQKHDVAAGHVFEVPKRYGPGLLLRGLPIEEVPEETPLSSPEHATVSRASLALAEEPPPDDPVARLWYDRAFAVRGEMDRAGAEVSALRAQLRHAASDTARETAAAFVGKIRAILEIEPDASVIEAIEQMVADRDSLTIERDELLQQLATLTAGGVTAPAEEPAAEGAPPPPPRAPRPRRAPAAPASSPTVEG